MAKYKYTYQKYNPKEMVRIVRTSVPISTKTSGEIAAFVKGKQIDNAMNYLEQVIVGKKAIPFKKHVRDIPHRKGMRTGRFPRKASKYVFDLLHGLKSNAQNQGFDTSKMIVVHAVAQKGPIIFHYGRRRLKRKNTHFEIIAKQVEEIKTKKKRKVKPAPKPVEKKEEVKKTQPEAKKEEKK